MKSYKYLLLFMLLSLFTWRAVAEKMDVNFPDTFSVWKTSVYQRFQINDVPSPTEETCLRAQACRNESVAFQLAAAWNRDADALRMSVTPLKGEEGEIAQAQWSLRFVDYVITREQGKVADKLTEAPERALKGGQIQPLWLTLHVPSSAAAGVYRGTVTVRCEKASPIMFPVEVTVLDALLPSPKDDTFYLDLWQHPGAIARYHRVPLWSEAHWVLLRAYTELLATAGQNPITACLIHDPWASQTRDPHPSMVRWVRDAAGKFHFDFSVFDRYVALCVDAGLTGPINCYSLVMGPGSRMDCPIRYWDEREGCFKQLDSEVGDEVWQGVWRDFFAVFIPHLKEKGWFENTCIALDEAPEKKMQAVLQAIPEGFKIALAGNYHADLDEKLYDYCLIYPGVAPEISAARRQRGQITTFYTCCGPDFPNTFTFSPPVESRLLAWNALKTQCDGYLRWAFASWPDSPNRSSAWGNWPSGDTFLVYPGPCSSIRFELLKQGIQDFDAYTLAQKKAPDDARLKEAVRRANLEHDGRKVSVEEVDAARRLVNAVLAETR